MFSNADRLMLRKTYKLALALNRKADLMSTEIVALKDLVTKVINDVNAKLAALLASSVSLSVDDKASIASMSDALTALDAKVNAPEAPPA